MTATERHAGLLDLAREAADRARRAVRSALAAGALPKAADKADGSAVTAIDLLVEDSLRSFFASATPDLAFFGEETAAGELPSAYEGWLVDPIDGTRQLLAGSPMFAVLICLVEAGEPVLSVIDYPMLGERLHAAPGAGCWFERGDVRTRAAVAAPPALGLRGAVVSSCGVHGTRLDPRSDAAWELVPIIHSSRDFLFIPDSYQHAAVIRGHIHGAIDTLMKPWDAAAIIPCIREAGGCVAGIGGGAPLTAGNLVTACDQGLLEALCATLSSGTGPGAGG